MTAHHVNNGHCGHCLDIMDKYPHLDLNLKGWFVMFQARHPEAHISCAGRGFKDQQEAYMNGASKARYSQSAHNYNCALDIICLLDGRKNPMDAFDNEHKQAWYYDVLAGEIPGFLNWYGTIGHPYFEQGHVELLGWHQLKDKGLIWLVEDIPQ